MTLEDIQEHCNEIRIALEIHDYEYLPKWITLLEKYTLELEKENVELKARHAKILFNDEIHIAKLTSALEEISMQGISRPMELGEGDDGDGWYKRIAFKLIRNATIALSDTKRE